MKHQPNPSCPACAGAAVRLSGEFHMGCTGCCARAAARSPQFREARNSRQQTRKYRALLAEFGLTHADVLAASNSDFESRGTT